MSETLIIVGVSLLFSAIGFFLGKYVTGFQSNASELSNEEVNKQLQIQLQQEKEIQSKLNLEVNTLRQDKEDAIIALTKKEALQQHLQEKLANQEQTILELQERFSKDFQLLANKILEEKFDNSWF